MSYDQQLADANAEIATLKAAKEEAERKVKTLHREVFELSKGNPEAAELVLSRIELAIIGSRYSNHKDCPPHLCAVKRAESWLAKLADEGKGRP